MNFWQIIAGLVLTWFFPLICGFIGFYVGMCVRMATTGYARGIKTPEELSEEKQLEEVRRNFGR